MLNEWQHLDTLYCFYFSDRNAFASLAGDTDCQKYQSSGATHHIFAAFGKYIILVQAFLNIIKEVIKSPI